MNHPELPKVLIPLNGTPIVLKLAQEISKIQLAYPPVVSVCFKHEMVEEVLGQKYIYAYASPDRTGTAHAVAAAKPKISASNVVILYGDMPFIKAESILKLITLHEQTNSIFSMFTATVEDYTGRNEPLYTYGRIIRQEGKILAIRELPDASDTEKIIQEVNPGIYAFNTQWLWDHIDLVQKNSHGEYYLTDLAEIAIREGVNIQTAGIDPAETFGINTPKQLEQAVKL